MFNLNIQECLLNKIKLREYCDNQQDCNVIYINDFLDFDFDLLNNSANLKDEETAQNVLHKIVMYLSDKIVNDLNLELLNHNITLKREKDICFVGDISDKYLPTSNNWRGIKIERLYNTKTQFSKIFIKNIAIWTKSPNCTAELKIKDGLKTTIINLDLKLGYNEKTINYIADSDEVYLLLDGNNQVNDSYIQLTKGCGCNVCGYQCNNLNIVGLDGNQETIKTFGLIVEVGEVCDFSLFFCSELDNMRLLIQEAFMSYAYEKSFISNRLNYDTIDKELILRKTKFFNDKYKESLKAYALNLSKTLIKYDSTCIMCNTPGFLKSFF